MKIEERMNVEREREILTFFLYPSKINIIFSVSILRSLYSNFFNPSKVNNIFFLCYYSHIFT